MTRCELLKIIRKHVGLIYVGMIAKNDVVYVRVVKSDLLTVIDKIDNNELEARLVKGDLYIDRAA